jgi:hypothetical protein
MCGVDFKKRNKQLIDARTRLISGKKLLIDQAEYIKSRHLKFDIKCSKCSFNIIYTLDLERSIKNIN